jgi:hypothetical protein
VDAVRAGAVVQFQGDVALGPVDHVVGDARRLAAHAVVDNDEDVVHPFDRHLVPFLLDC